MIPVRAVLFAVLVLLDGLAVAAPPAETCDLIRNEIRDKIRIPDKVDAILLKKIAARTDCRFSAAEVYRAAYGDKPIPREHRHERHIADDEADDD